MDFRVVIFYEFENRLFLELKKFGFQIGERELMKFVEVVNFFYGGDSLVFIVIYDLRRDEYYLKIYGSVGFVYYLGDDGIVFVQVLLKFFRYDREDGCFLLFFFQFFNMYYQMGFELGEIRVLVFEYGRQKVLDEIFKYFYVFMFFRVLFRGFYYEYGEIEESFQIVCGRIFVNEFVWRLVWKVDLFVRYLFFFEDNFFNRVLKGVLEVVVKFVCLSEMRKVGGIFFDFFRDVGDLKFGDFGKVFFNYFNERFRMVFRLVWVMYFGLVVGGLRKFFLGVFIRMDEFFEMFVYRMLKIVFDNEVEVRFQVQLFYVIKNVGEIEVRFGVFFMMGNFFLDIVVSIDEGICVVEVKYRNFYVYYRGENRVYRKFVRKSDEFYQVYMYFCFVSEYLGVKRVLVFLVYLWFEGIYNYWILNFFSVCLEDIFEFFDGMRVGVFGYEFLMIGDEILLRKNLVVIDEDIVENLKFFIFGFCFLGEV